MADTATATKKVSQEESGDAKNLAALRTAITHAEGFGAAYNPSYQNISLASLRSFYTDCEKALSSSRTVCSKKTLPLPLLEGG